MAISRRRWVTCFIYYDALPLTHPRYFSHRADDGAALTRYHHVIASSENVAFISQSSRDTFEQRLARRRTTNGIVARPGADGLQPHSAQSSATPAFVVVGTVEARKRIGVVLDAFEQIWSAGRDYGLVVLGARGPEQPDVIQRLEALSRKKTVSWLDRAGDDVISDALARSAAMLFLSDAEGCGVPPLEALHAGCPVVVSAKLPALERLSDAGQIRLEEVTAEGVRFAIETMADPDRNAEFRRAIQGLELPTWKQFARDIEEWIANAVNKSRVDDPPRYRPGRSTLRSAQR
ncbi:MAG: glycosyltransferase [Gaiellaceae bacterium]